MDKSKLEKWVFFILYFAMMLPAVAFVVHVAVTVIAPFANNSDSKIVLLLVIVAFPLLMAAAFHGPALLVGEISEWLYRNRDMQ